MKFVRSLWSFVKAHPLGSAVTFLLVVPLVAGGVAVAIYRAIKGAVTKVAPGLGAALPEK